MDHAEDVIEILFEHGISRVGGVGEDLADRVGPGADRDADDSHPRHHHLAGGEVAELEELLQHLAGLRAQRAELLALLDDQLQFLGRVVLLRVLTSGD